MFGELNVGHAYHGGGDIRSGKKIGTGLLAADLRYDPATGFWQIQKIYRGDYPMPDWTSPLARADLRVKPGQWLVAIDGKPLVKGEDYLKRLANRAGPGSRTVDQRHAQPRRTRAASWSRRSAGHRSPLRRLGPRKPRIRGQEEPGPDWLHPPLRHGAGAACGSSPAIIPPQWRKHGLIMDDRWNHGGFVAPMILAHLDRKILAVGGTRYGNVDTVPSHAFSGYLACLINRQGGSDCETFALGFKQFKLGPVIGTRTWGGWVGIRGDKPLARRRHDHPAGVRRLGPQGHRLDHRGPRRRSRRRTGPQPGWPASMATTCNSTTPSNTCWPKSPKTLATSRPHRPSAPARSNQCAELSSSSMRSY